MGGFGGLGGLGHGQGGFGKFSENPSEKDFMNKVFSEDKQTNKLKNEA